jgi:sortase (surface protein transpeptidase)
LTGLRSRILLLSVIVALLVAAIPPTTSAATIRRTWTATISGLTAGGATAGGATAGGATASGTAVLVRDWAGTGSLTTQIAGLLPTSTYAVVVYVGTCSKPTVLLRLPNLAVDADGNAAAASSVTLAQMARVWSKAEVGGIALRIAAGADVHCAALTSPVATRVAVPSLGIDLPIVLQRGNAFPWCNVAMYMNGLSQPGEAGVSFIYAHARTRMFLPLLKASLVNNGARMLGMKVYVWTSDDRQYTYQITQVRRHQYTLPNLWSMTSQQVWLQTSEGPYGTLNKLMVVARRIAVTTATHAAAHPRARPAVCSLY